MVWKWNKAEGTMNMTTDELDDAANPNTSQVWIASLWTALVMASVGSVLLGDSEAPDEPDACLVTSDWAEPVALP
jgi:hypothetical protein